MDSAIDDEESCCYNERNELTQRRNLLSVTEYIYNENGSLIREKSMENINSEIREAGNGSVGRV